MNKVISILVVSAIIVLGFLYFKEKKNSPVENLVAETTPTNSDDTQTNTEPDKESPKTPTPTTLHMFDTSNGNPSARSTIRYAIIMAEVRYATKNPICGNGNDFVAPCGIYLQDNQVKTEKVSEWPNVDVYKKYPEIFGPSSELYLTYYPPNFYIKDSLSLDGNNVFFDTNSSPACSTTKQHWRFDIQTKDYELLSQEKPIVEDCD